MMTIIVEIGSGDRPPNVATQLLMVIFFDPD